MNNRDKAIREAAQKICKEMADRGCLIEGGFRALLLNEGIEPSSAKAAELRAAYFAGAQHLFASIFGTLDPGTQETEADLRRIALLNDELNRWVTEQKAREGSAS